MGRLLAHTTDRWPAADLVALVLRNGPEVTGSFPPHHRRPRCLGYRQLMAYWLVPASSSSLVPHSALIW